MLHGILCTLVRVSVLGSHNNWTGLGLTSGCLDICFEQYTFEFSVPNFHFPGVIPHNIRIVMHEMFELPIQFSQNVVQTSDEVRPVMTHPDSTETIA